MYVGSWQHFYLISVSFCNLIFHSFIIFQVKVTPQHNKECKELLALMGIPYVDVNWDLLNLLVKGYNVFDKFAMLKTTILKL